ncbi:hypothetical protein ALUC_60903A [Aspergillus luchuensis]|nr:hypothetical protein ALUC_60903A [Aspergillus luchuensis]
MALLVEVPGSPTTVLAHPRQKEFNEYLNEPGWPGEFRSKREYKEALHLAKRMQGISQPIVFTHGDLQYYNIKVQDGRITGLSDWGGCWLVSLDFALSLVLGE